MSKVFIHIVTWNSEKFIEACIQSILDRTILDQTENESIIHVTDNASSDRTLKILAEKFPNKISIAINKANLGFSAAHNQGFKLFLESKAEYCLVLNPDVRLSKNCVAEFLKVAKRNPEYNIFTPKILRADDNLNPLDPKVIDAAGMILDCTLRHLDRGSGMSDMNQFNTEESIFGGTGAAMFLTRNGVNKLSVKGARHEDDLYKIYPELKAGSQDRIPVFDEAFFAYREDAELCWRGNNIGIRTLYCPNVVLFHRRVVLPERRKDLPAAFNLYSVRNRFLMQVVNYSVTKQLKALLPGLIFRNLIVIIGVLLKERSSIPGLLQVFTLWNRAWERRQIIFRKSDA